MGIFLYLFRSKKEIRIKKYFLHIIYRKGCFYEENKMDGINYINCRNGACRGIVCADFRRIQRILLTACTTCICSAVSGISCGLGGTLCSNGLFGISCILFGKSAEKKCPDNIYYPAFHKFFMEHSIFQVQSLAACGGGCGTACNSCCGYDYNFRESKQDRLTGEYSLSLMEHICGISRRRILCFKLKKLSVLRRVFLSAFLTCLVHFSVRGHNVGVFKLCGKISRNGTPVFVS